MKIRDIISAVQIAVAVGKSLATRKVSKTLEKIEDAAGIAKAVEKLVKKK